MRLSQLAFGALAILFVASCKVRLIVPEGGSVTTSSGAYSCTSGKTCNVDVLDFFFDETFIAKPKSGYIFKYWKKGDRRFCGENSKPCRLFTTAFTGDWVDPVAKLLESDEVFYLQPIFEMTGTGVSSCPLYAANSVFCAAGEMPSSCTITIEQGYQIIEGMTYSEVAEILGCHGELTGGRGSYGTYTWGKYGGPIIGVGFECLECTRPTEPTAYAIYLVRGFSG